MLVRVYGVVREPPDAPPTLDVEYARVFPWKTFTFIHCCGKDDTNPQGGSCAESPSTTSTTPPPDDNDSRQRLGSGFHSGFHSQQIIAVLLRKVMTATSCGVLPSRRRTPVTSDTEEPCVRWSRS